MLKKKIKQGSKVISFEENLIIINIHIFALSRFAFILFMSLIVESFL